MKRAKKRLLKFEWHSQKRGASSLSERKRALQARCFELIQTGERTQASFLWFAPIATTATVTYKDEEFD